MIRVAATAVLLVLSGSHALANQTGPYAGQQEREIKALSAQEAQDYLDGKGMGLAKAAELNHFPGPAHVLELADPLKLTPEQLEQTRRIFSAMSRAAKENGRMLVDKEIELDRLFATQSASDARLRSLLNEIGLLQGELRRIHLQAHIEQRAVLAADQIAAYDVLRGYSASTPEHPNRGHHH